MSDKTFATIVSVGLYIAIVILLTLNLSSTPKKSPKHFVAKNSGGITVSLAGGMPTETLLPPAKVAKPQKITPKKEIPKKIKPKKRVVKKKTIKKKVVKKKIVKKRINRKKVTKKVHKTKKKTIKKKINTKSLFANIGKSTNKTNSKKRLDSGSGNSGNRGDKGFENGYFAKVEKMLRGWPAQSNFAGEKIYVKLKIYKDGHFDFKILQRSNNSSFNKELTAYLKQLQRVGFGYHHRDKPYDIEVEFIAR